jgi:Ca-activated chloride channel family protein
MENQDKLYNQFKDAARKAEDKGFDRMEAVWNRVEEKLDTKKERRTGIWWKYSGIAAMLLLSITVGTFMFRNEGSTVAPQAIPENNVTTIDTARIKEVRDAIKEGVQHEEVVVNEIQPVKDAEQGFVTGDSVYFAKGARFTTSKDQKNPEYYFHSNKIKVIPGKKVVAGSTNMWIADVPEPTELGEAVIDVYRSTTVRQSPAAVTTISTETIAKNNAAPAVGKPIQTQGTYQKSFKDGDNPSMAMGYISEDRKKEMSSTTLSIEAIEDRANANIIQNLQGQIAELNIATGNGQPGADSTIILRGVGTINGNVEPLYVVDGVPVDEAGFRTINQEDITSIKVLKNAAATSIYGNRGANGVIVITTKNSPEKAARHEVQKGLRSNTKDAPYVLINGVPAKKKRLKALKTEDIESVLVLSDEAAERLYGKAATGVYIVKTKDRNDVEEQQIQKLIKKLEYQGKNTYQEIRYIPERVKVDQEEYESFIENQFENPTNTPLSTFSIDVDNASYTNIRRFLNNGQVVPKDAVRVEEMINFFKYTYPQPKGDEPFSINTEYSDAPWNPKHKLLKIGLQGKEIPSAKLPASNFVFLIDVSGSMDEPNKLPLLKESMKVLVKQMRKEDRIAIVVYAGAAGLVLPSTSGAEKEKIIAALENLSAGGSTAGGAGIELAYKTAQENFVRGGNNRVILATDGDFNVGASSNADMQTLIEEKRKSGVFLTCLGYGMGNYKDSKLETLADKGNGNYAYIDNMQEADRFLQKEFKGSMYAIAKDVKIQIEFNPKHVQSYRLIGYENRKLRDEDFANDTIDAGELGSGHTVTALYEIIPVGVKSDFFTAEPQLKYSTPQIVATGNYNAELATIKFRHKKPEEDVSKETVQVIMNKAVSLKNASGDFKFSAAVAWFGLKLRDSKLMPNKKSSDIKALAKEGLANDPEGYRAEFIRLVDMVE